VVVVGVKPDGKRTQDSPLLGDIGVSLSRIRKRIMGLLNKSTRHRQ
jgi:hypothetical protein